MPETCPGNLWKQIPAIIHDGRNKKIGVIRIAQSVHDRLSIYLNFNGLAVTTDTEAQTIPKSPKFLKETSSHPYFASKTHNPTPIIVLDQSFTSCNTWITEWRPIGIQFKPARIRFCLADRSRDTTGGLSGRCSAEGIFQNTPRDYFCKLRVRTLILK